MNDVKVYTAPSARMLVLVPEENLAVGDWRFGSFEDDWWYHGYKQGTDTAASSVGITKNGAWAEDGYTLNSSSSSS